MMALGIYKKGNHGFVVFTDLVVGGGGQANQVLISDNGHG